MSAIAPRPYHTETFGQFLHRHRISLGISLHDLGNKVGAKKREITDWEADIGRPSGPQLFKLRRVFRWTGVVPGMNTPSTIADLAADAATAPIATVSAPPAVPAPFVRRVRPRTDAPPPPTLPEPAPVSSTGKRLSFGQALRKARQDMGFTIREVAELVGVSRGAVAFWEDDTTAPVDENRAKLVELFPSLAAAPDASQPIPVPYGNPSRPPPMPGPSGDLDPINLVISPAVPPGDPPAFEPEGIDLPPHVLLPKTAPTQKEDPVKEAPAPVAPAASVVPIHAEEGDRRRAKADRDRALVRLGRHLGAMDQQSRAGAFELLRKAQELRLDVDDLLVALEEP